MRIIARARLAAALALLSAAPAAAQYNTAAKDTLRYREETRGSVVMQPPNGTMTVNTLHDALLGITFTGAGRAAAWYEALTLEQQGPGPQERRPDTRPVLGQRFVLAFDDRGRVATESSPPIPAEIAAMTDLTRQFDDFFISLPAAALAVGTAWADTLVHDRPGRPQDTYRSKRVRNFRVERDTVVAGARAWVIRVHQEIVMEASSPFEQPGLSAASELKGTEEGFAVFSQELGRLLARERTGRLEGEFRILGGATPVSFPQIYEYRSRLALQH